MTSCALGFGSILDGFCATELPINVSKPRSVIVDRDSEQIFVLERGTESIVHLYDSDGDGIPDTKDFVASAAGLNHGLAIFDGYIYASSDSDVYRWPLYESIADGSIIGTTETTTTTTKTKSSFPLTVDPETIVTNINEDGMGGAPQGHTTRTMAFDKSSGTMYLSVGSNQNVDPDSYRSRIRRFGDFRNSANTASFPLDFQTMEVFADGLRNEVGLAFDQHGILWGVENSADKLFRDDLGGDIHEDNPAEELNRFDPNDPIARHYGYPYCWTEYNFPLGNGPGHQWVWPSFHSDYGGTMEDSECRAKDLYTPPALSMQGHSAPLGITFFRWTTNQESCQGIRSFPKAMDGFAFIAFHGSWNRDVPTGYKVVYVKMDSTGNIVVSGDGAEPTVFDLLAHQSPDAKWEDGFRPVDVAFDGCGRLLVTSDGTRGVGSKVVRIEYKGGAGDYDDDETKITPSSSGNVGIKKAGVLEQTTTTLLLCLVWALLAMG